MSKDLDQEKDYGKLSIKLEVEQQYNLGDFTILLEETGELRVTIHKNRAYMSIKPSSGNCIFISNLKKKVNMSKSNNLKSKEVPVFAIIKENRETIVEFIYFQRRNYIEYSIELKPSSFSSSYDPQCVYSPILLDSLVITDPYSINALFELFKIKLESEEIEVKEQNKNQVIFNEENIFYLKAFNTNEYLSFKNIQFEQDKVMFFNFLPITRTIADIKKILYY